jgi:hypothetical protein
MDDLRPHFPQLTPHRHAKATRERTQADREQRQRVWWAPLFEPKPSNGRLEGRRPREEDQGSRLGRLYSGFH